ncbi:chemotaxis protein CheW [Aestuariibacter halophilus]|uniref:Chemotaxis protein CheW n=1 Tax=Fluctibacter halophilus TaxID=226011 RepID=A0ABS8G692_9ALTE|nr:chemotaxis protein CheW [Aestuariibacter halophilus]MCC2616033.1 chemotaxis protein CheW [Aestuariibacter halophilus]
MQEHSEHIQILNVSVGQDIFGIHITRVQEIRVLTGLRKLPDSPAQWIGIIDFRDQMVPVLDLRILFHGKQPPLTDKTVVVVVNAPQGERDFLVGLVVDSVSDVASIKQQSIRPAPVLEQLPQQMVAGLYKVDDQLMVLLDVPALLRISNVSDVRSTLASLTDEPLCGS